MSAPSDLLWLLDNTMPVAGERAAARESWWNVLEPYVGRTEAYRLIDVAAERWRQYDAPMPAPYRRPHR